MGGGLRAHHLGVGLRAAGWEVQFLCKAQWLSHWSQVISSTIENLSPDAILCSQLEDAALLPTADCPIIIDLYAPRLLEVAFAQDQQQTAASILLAISRGDVFLLTNHRQRWHWMGIFALAGIDVRSDPSLIVPLAAEISPKDPT